jgi:hypothetical protein
VSETNPPIQISIQCSGDEPTAVPNKRSVPFGTHDIVWNPTPQVTVTSITFDAPDAPFTTPEEQQNGSWKSTDSNDNETGEVQSWLYTIEGSCSGARPVAVDPEILNDPKGGPEDDTGKPPQDDAGGG